MEAQDDTRLETSRPGIFSMILYGVDYDVTFAPVTNMATLGVMIGLRAQGYHVRQLDVDTAYLNAKLNEDIYLTQPKGFHDNTEFVCKLNKAIYGLKPDLHGTSTSQEYYSIWDLGKQLPTHACS